MRKRCLICLAAFVFLAALVPGLWAQSQSNLMISPPPVPWFEFVKGQKDLRLGGTYVSITGDESSSGANDEIDFTGVGLGLMGRYAFNDYLALDMGFNYIYVGGEVGKTSVDVWLWSIPADLELQLVNKDRVGIILFGGVNKTWSVVDVEGTSATVNLFGPQGGLEVAFKFTDFVVTPFFMIQKMSGTVEVNSKSYTISSFTTKAYGLDVVYKPWNLTLSGIFQQAATQSNQDYDTVLISLNYDFRWGGAEEGAREAPKPKPEPVKPAL